MHYKHYKKYAALLLGCLLLSPLAASLSRAESEDWQLQGIVQTYYQTYNGSAERNNSYNLGVYLSADYLDTANISAGYNYTMVDFTQNSELSEDMYYLSGRWHFYPDALPGKLTARLDLFSGSDTLSYPSNVAPPSIHGRHKTTPLPGGSGTISQTTNIFTYYPQLSFINYAKTFYVDIGYAYSDYESDTTISATQLTPTIGFGWNDSYDWLQLRGYLIKVSGAASTYDDNEFNSLETVYTHWYPDVGTHDMEFIRFSVLLGERVLAVDPDAAVIYSAGDKETGALTASVQWKLAETRKLLLLGRYAQFQNDAIDDKYDGLLLYINLQQQF